MLVLAGKSPAIMLLKTGNKSDSNGKTLYQIPAEDYSASDVSGVCWSPTSSLLALCGKKWEHILLLHCGDPDKQTEVQIDIPSGRYQNCCVFNKSGKTLATAGVGGSVYLWNENCATGRWECAAELANITMTTVTSISYDPSSQYLCTGDTRGHVTVREHLSDLEYRDGVDLYTTSSSSEEVSALTCNPHHPFQPPEVAVGHSNGVLEIWDLLSRTVRITVHSHSTTITDIAYSTINGLLLATSGLDGEIHIVLLKSGVVVKKCVQGRPIHSLEFIKGTQKLVFLTDSALVTFRLNKKWSERESEAQQGAQIVRHHTARGPLFESQEAYLARTPNKTEGVGRVQIVKNTPEYNPDKPSPENKALPRDEMSSQHVTPFIKELGGSKNITEEEENNTTADKDSSFNISDIVSYTIDEKSNTPASHHRIPSIQKRSAEGILPDNIISPDSNTDQTPSRSDNSPYSENLRNKMRRIAVEDGKENRPPGNRVTPQDLVTKNSGRLVASTPAVSNKQIYLTPTSGLAQSSKGRAGFSVSSLLSSVGNNNSPRLTEPSSLGIISQEKLSTNIGIGGESSQTPSHVLHQVDSERVINNEQMVILQNQITEHFKGLEKTLLSETRWLKNEIVRQAVDTQFALEDILNTVQEKQATIEQRLVNMEHNISSIMRNM